jgi:hypothetical protein
MMLRLLTISTFAVFMIALTACSDQQQQQTTSKAPAMPLNEAAFKGDAATVQQHIDAGTSLDEKDEFGSTPLIVATVFGHTDAAIALINGGADLEIPNNEGSTALHVAAFFCRPEIAEALLAKGANKDAVNNFGQTPYQSVAGPYEEVKPFYDAMGKMLGPMGLTLDENYLRETRPKMAAMLTVEGPQ